jgi:hypothetical protein
LLRPVRGEPTRTRVSEHPPCFPPKRSLETAPPSLSRVHSPVPPRHRYYEALRPPAVRLAALRCLRLAIPRFAPEFAPSDRDARSWAPGSWYSGSRAGSFRGGGRVSQVPGQPFCPYALFLDPGRTEDVRPLRRLDMAPACVNNEGSRDEKVSGLDHTALGLAVYASQWRLPDTTQDSLPAARPSLAGRDFVTRRVAAKGF